MRKENRRIIMGKKRKSLIETRAGGLFYAGSMNTCLTTKSGEFFIVLTNVS